MYTHIVIPIAFDHEADEGPTFAVAEQLRADGGRVTLLHCIPPVPNFAVSYIPENVLQEGRRDAAARLDAFAAQLSPAGEAAIIQGSPGVEIVEFAEREQVDCIVMRSHQPGLQDYFLGSTAARVVRHAPCSVHVIR